MSQGGAGKSKVTPISLVISGLTKISECDNLELTAGLASSVFDPIDFKWDITFDTVSPFMTENEILEAENYFLEYTEYTENVGISIPNTYFKKSAVLNVKLTVRVKANNDDTTSTNVTVDIVGDIPKVKFTSKAQAITILPGDEPSELPVIIGNKICAKTQGRLLQNETARAVNISFQVFSGTDKDLNPKQSDALEQKIQGKINEMFADYTMIVVNRSDGFLVGRNYKLVATIVDPSTGKKNQDFIVFSFMKAAITAVIDPLGSIVSMKQDIKLSGINSIIPEPGNDVIAYVWRCKDALSVATKGCACPIMTDSQLKGSQIVIPKSKLKELCTYIYTLSVTATMGKMKRVSSDMAEFTVVKVSLLPVTGIITPGTNNAENDYYFSFALSNDGPDENITYKWNLVEVKGLEINSTINYTIKNTYIGSFLNRIGVNLNVSKLKDKPIPDDKKLKYTTEDTARVLGVNLDSMIPKTQYVFAVDVNYPSNPSFAFVAFVTPQKVRDREFSITPKNGTGFKTQFSFMFSLTKAIAKDKANYQLLRRDCPSSNNPTSPITQQMTTSSCYTGSLAPGNKSCNHQVEVILRAFEYDNSKDFSTIITVTSGPETSSDLLGKQLNGLAANKKYLNPSQTIGVLNELSSVTVPEQSSSGEASINKTLDLLSTVDSPDSGSRSLLSDTKIPGLLNTTSSTMAKMLKTQTVNVNPSVAGGITDKISTNLNDSNDLPGGTSVITSCLDSLSGVALVGKTKDANSSLYDNLQKTLNMVPDMKLKEAQPGANPYSVTTDNIEVIAKSNYLSDYNKPQEASTGKGNEMKLPEGLGNSLSKDKINKTNNTSTVSISMNAIAYNPYPNIKRNSALNLSDLNNANDSLVSPQEIQKLYSDLNKGNLNNSVNMKEQPADIIQVGFAPFEILKNGTTRSTSSSIDTVKLPEGKEVEWGFPDKEPKANSSNSSRLLAQAKDILATPLYYSPENKTWTNKGCKAVMDNKTGKLKAICKSMGDEGGKKLVKEALSITMDIIKDVLKVLSAGNYAMLFSFGAFKNAGLGTYLVLFAVAFVLLFSLYLAYYLNQKDKRALFEEEVTTLYVRYEKKETEEFKGILSNVFQFLSNVKRKNYDEASKDGNEPSAEKKDNSKEQGSVVVKGLAEKKKENAEKEPWPKKPINGFSVIYPQEEKELKNLFYSYDEHCKIFLPKGIFKRYNDELANNKILKRLTQVRIEDNVGGAELTFCSLLSVIKYK